MPEISLAPIIAPTPVRAPESGASKLQNTAGKKEAEATNTFAETMRAQRKSDQDKASKAQSERPPEKPVSQTAPKAEEQGATAGSNAEAADANARTVSRDTQADEAARAAQAGETRLDPTTQALLLAANMHLVANPQALTQAGGVTAQDADQPLSVDTLTSPQDAEAANLFGASAKAAGGAASIAAAGKDDGIQANVSGDTGKEIDALAAGGKPESSVDIDTQQTASGKQFAAELERFIGTNAEQAAASKAPVDSTSLQVNHTYGSLDAKAASAPELPTRQVIATPVGHQNWAEEVGNRVSWVATKDNGMAELILTPPQLGRIEVSVNVNGDQASAQFVAASQAARDALNDAMPRLREMLAQAGINLGQADVSAQHSQQSGQDQSTSGRRGGDGRHGRGGDVADAAIASTSGGWSRQGTGLVDTFA